MRVIREGIEANDKDESGDFVLGVVTPFRAQATGLRQRIRADLGEGQHARWLAETAHKFQGRGAGTVVLSTVLNAHDRAAAREFYDSDAMTNVIVSRAKDRFIVVTTHGGVRLSRNIRTLLDYIEMYDPSAVVQSDIVPISMSSTTPTARRSNATRAPSGPTVGARPSRTLPTNACARRSRNPGTLALAIRPKYSSGTRCRTLVASARSSAPSCSRIAPSTSGCTRG